MARELEPALGKAADAARSFFGSLLSSAGTRSTAGAPQPSAASASPQARGAAAASGSVPAPPPDGHFGVYAA